MQPVVKNKYFIYEGQVVGVSKTHFVYEVSRYTVYKDRVEYLGGNFLLSKTKLNIKHDMAYEKQAKTLSKGDYHIIKYLDLLAIPKEETKYLKEWKK